MVGEEIKVNFCGREIVLWKPVPCKICGVLITSMTKAYRLSDMHTDCFHNAINKGEMDIMDFWAMPSAPHNKLIGIK